MRAQKKGAPALRPALFHPMEPLDLLDPVQGLPRIPLQDHELRYGPGQMPVKLPPRTRHARSLSGYTRLRLESIRPLRGAMTSSAALKKAAVARALQPGAAKA